jgi:hypothetical protein
VERGRLGREEAVGDTKSLIQPSGGRIDCLAAKNPLKPPKNEGAKTSRCANLKNGRRAQSIGELSC